MHSCIELSIKVVFQINAKIVKETQNDHLSQSLDLIPSKILWSELKRCKFERKFKRA